MNAEQLKEQIKLIKTNPEYIRLLTTQRNLKDDQRFKAYCLHLQTAENNLKKLESTSVVDNLKPIGKLRKAAIPQKPEELITQVVKIKNKGITKPSTKTSDPIKVSTSNRTMISSTILNDIKIPEDQRQQKERDFEKNIERELKARELKARELKARELKARELKARELKTKQAKKINLDNINEIDNIDPLIMQELLNTDF